MTQEAKAEREAIVAVQFEPLSHEAAIDAICGCARTVTVLSYQEAIEGYFTLRGLQIP